MQINLKQPEIEQALRAYVMAQGISLHGKDLSIAFTAGRRESGISAEISIDDVEIPGYTNDVPEVPQAPKATVVTLAPAAVEPAADEQPEAVAPVEEELAQETKATTSLFG